VAIAPRAFVPPDDYLPRVRDICSEYGVYLICDEVVDGFGRTGKMFAVEHWDVTPDILCLSKGIASGYMPLAATIATEEVYSHFSGEQSRLFHHGHTYGAHPVAAAVAIKNIEIIQREGLVEKAAINGALFLGGLKKLKKHPIVFDVQGKGLLLGIRLAADRQSKKAIDPAVSTRIAQLMYEKGFWTMISFICPPLVITDKEIREAVDAFDESIAQTCEEFGL
jgi:adenosylmethionine-8-amino-7-oxononanoate aminotransferase